MSNTMFNAYVYAMEKAWEDSLHHAAISARALSLRDQPHMVEVAITEADLFAEARKVWSAIYARIYR